MRQNGSDEGGPAKRGSGMPTWLIVVLSVVLLLGLLCVGAVGLMVYGVKSGMDTIGVEATRAQLNELQMSARQYQLEYNTYPASLKQLDAQQHGGQMFADYRGNLSQPAPVAYLPPASNAADSDVLAHTPSDGVMPILAVLVSGEMAEYKSKFELDQALAKQRNRPLPPDALNAADPSRGVPDSQVLPDDPAAPGETVIPGSGTRAD